MIGFPSFSAKGTSNNASSHADVQAAPGTGKYLSIYDVTISVAGAMNVNLQDEDDNQIGPVLMFPAAGIFTKTFSRPLVVDENKALEIITSTSGVIKWHIGGDIVTK